MNDPKNFEIFQISSPRPSIWYQLEDSRPILSDFSMRAVTNCISAFIRLFFMDDPKFRKPGSMEAWKHGSMESLEAWKHGSMEAWKHGKPGSLEAWKHGSMEAWKHGSVEAWNPGSMEAWKHWSMETWIQVFTNALQRRKFLNHSGLLLKFGHL